MIDVMITLPIADGLPILLLMHRVQQMGLPFDRGKAAAFTAIGHGSMALGIAVFLVFQMLLVVAVEGGIILYYHWKFRGIYSSNEEITATMEGIKELPYTWIMRRMIFNHILKETIRHITAEAQARKKRQGII